MRLTKNFKSLFVFSFLLLFFFEPLFAKEIPRLTIEPTSFSKIIVRIPNFEGDKNLSQKLTPLLRRLLNYHLFVLTLRTPPLAGYPSKEYYLKGEVEKLSNQILIKAKLIDIFKNRTFIYKINCPLDYPEIGIYFLSDKIIEKISSYKGIAFSKIAFVKRTSYGDRLYIMDFSKINPRLIRIAPLILFPKFSPRGDKLAYLVYDKNKYILEIYNLKTGKRKIFDHIYGLCSAPVWLPNEKELILTVEQGENISFYKLNISTHKLDLILRKSGVIQAGSVSPDGKLLAYVYKKPNGCPQIYLLNLQTFKTFKIPQKFSYNTSPRFSPKNNDVLLYLSRGKGITSLVLYNLKTKEQKRITFFGLLEDPAFSPTGDYIIAYGESIKGKGLYLIHLDSHLNSLYLAGENFIFPNWAKSTDILLNLNH